MSPLIITPYENDYSRLTAFTRKGDFAGWIVKKAEGWQGRPANGWRVAMFETVQEAKRYLIVSIKK